MKFTRLTFVSAVFASTALSHSSWAQGQQSNAIDVGNYGVVYDGVTDSTAAMRAAFAAAQSFLNRGIPVVLTLGPGTIAVNGSLALDASRASVTIVGAGSGTTTIVEKAGGDVLDALDGAMTSAHFQHFSIVRSAAGNGGGTAISLDNRGGMQQTGKAVFNDLVISAASGDGGFGTGIALHSQSIPAIEDVKIAGPYRGAQDDGSSGILIDGYAAGSGFSINTKITDTEIQGQWAGIRIGDWVQGVFVSNSDIIGSTVGVNWMPDPGTGAEYLSVNNSHINTSGYGLRLSGTNGLVSNCYFLAFKTGNQVWHAVDAANMSNLSVTGNMFRTQNGLGNGDTGIRYSGSSSWGSFSGNTFDDFTVAIQLDNAAWGTIAANVYVNNTQGLLNNAQSWATHVLN